MPLPSSLPHFLQGLRPHRHTGWITLIAFVIGLLLFGLVWQKEHNRAASERATVAPTAADPVFQPLPEPKPADAGGASEMQPAPIEDAEPIEWTEVPSAPAHIKDAPSPDSLPPAAPAETVAQPDVPPPSASSAPLPLPGYSPPPEYPARALRRGEGGTVRIQVEVDVDGNPRRVSVIERSGSRQLDRAAVNAVRHWRFQPALQGGQPVPGTVVIPVDFDPQTGTRPQQQ